MSDYFMMRKCVLIVLLLFSLPSYSASAEYQMVMMTINSDKGSWGAIKFNSISGQSWYVSKGAFFDVLEEKPIKKSEYIVNVVETKKGWRATRLDINSGAAWYYTKKTWVRILEPK